MDGHSPLKTPATPTTLGWRALRDGYLPMLLSFVLAQVSLQIDLITLARVSNVQQVAYVALMRIGLVDIVLTMALGSVAGLVIARARQTGAQAQAVAVTMTAALACGALLMPLGMLCYPALARALIADGAVAAEIAHAAPWFALAAPLRCLAAAGAFALLALGMGRTLTAWKLAEIGIKAATTGIAVLWLGLGLAGCYLASLGVLAASCGWQAWCLRAPLRSGLAALATQPMLAYVRQAGWEGARMLSTHLFALATVVLFACATLGADVPARLGALAAGTALSMLLLAPLTAWMRYLGTTLSARNDADRQAALHGAVIPGFSLALLVALTLVAGGPVLGQWMYAQSGPWWQAFVTTLAVALPLKYLSTLARADLQAAQRLALAFRADFLAAWLVGLPMAAAGLALDLPWLAFGNMVLMELAWLGWYLTSRYRLMHEGDREAGGAAGRMVEGCGTRQREGLKPPP